MLYLKASLIDIFRFERRVNSSTDVDWQHVLLTLEYDLLINFMNNNIELCFSKINLK